MSRSGKVTMFVPARRQRAKAIPKSRPSCRLSLLRNRQYSRR